MMKQKAGVTLLPRRIGVPAIPPCREFMRQTKGKVCIFKDCRRNLNIVEQPNYNGSACNNERIGGE
jgi:hypothetical protein